MGTIEKAIPWVVLGIAAYFIVTKTTIIQNFSSALKNLGSGGGGAGPQTAQAQPQAAPDASTSSTPPATASAPAPATGALNCPPTCTCINVQGKGCVCQGNSNCPCSPCTAAGTVGATATKVTPVSPARAPAATKQKAGRNSNGKVVAAGQAGKPKTATTAGVKFDPRVCTSGPETGVGCCGSGSNAGTRHWYTPGTNAQHARHHCFEGAPCCYLNGVPT